MAERITVLVCDDHAVVREGLRSYLDLQPELVVIGEAAHGAEAIRQAERLAPNVVLMDLAMPGLDGVSAMRELRRRVPSARVIVLTSFADDEHLLGAMQAGAAGFLLKNVEPAELVRAIHAAASGQALLDPTVAARLIEAISEPSASRPRPGLTRRELDVLRLIARGYPNKRIALELGVSEKTVKTHITHLFGKLGVTDRTQAALHAVRAGLVRPES